MEGGVKNTVTKARFNSASSNERSRIAAASLMPLVNEIAGSLDFHTAQGDGNELRRVVLSGGGARLRALRGVLEEQLAMSFDVLVAEDLTGHGHIALSIGEEFRVSLAIPLADG